MKKTYIKPHTECVRVNLYGSVLDNGATVAGQSKNLVATPQDPGKVVWSGKGQTFTDDEEENPWGNGSTNLWDN